MWTDSMLPTQLHTYVSLHICPCLLLGGLWMQHQQKDKWSLLNYYFWLTNEGTQLCSSECCRDAAWTRTNNLHMGFCWSVMVQYWLYFNFSALSWLHPEFNPNHYWSLFISHGLAPGNCFLSDSQEILALLYNYNKNASCVNCLEKKLSCHWLVMSVKSTEQNFLVSLSILTTVFTHTIIYKILNLITQHLSLSMQAWDLWAGLWVISGTLAMNHTWFETPHDLALKTILNISLQHHVWSLVISSAILLP